MNIKKYTYLDHNSTSYLSQGALEVIEHFSKDKMQINPSASNDISNNLKIKIEDIRNKISSSLGFKSLIFTSGATEANNTIINDDCNKIFVLDGDHSSLINTRFNIQFIECKSNGQICLESLENAFINYKSLKTLKIFCFSLVRSISGILIDIEKAYEICKKYNVFLHCDITQAIGKIPIDIIKNSMKMADSASMSGHKIGALQGIGCLLFKNQYFRPLLYGGAQEISIRAGTENVLGIMTLEKAFDEILFSNIQDIQYKRDSLENGLLQISKNIKIICHDSKRAANTSCVYFDKFDAEIFKMILESQYKIICSYGTACLSSASSIPKELIAMKIENIISEKCIRFSIHKDTSNQEIEYTIQSIKEIYNQ